jgi:2-polyprenyl-3-methyl-5-hydroxy-6-metoxy-1,4-benzoquinol methylase
MKVNHEIWEKTHADRQWGSYPPEDLVRFIAKRYGSISREERSSISVLDVGCGQGANTWFLAREGFAVTAVDISPSAIEKAKSYLKNERLEARFEVGDFGSLPYARESFDCIIDVESLYTGTSKDIAAAYAFLSSLLKPGGSFFTMSFSTACSNFGTGKKIEEHTFTDIPHGSPSTGIAHYFDRDELKSLFRSVNFKDIEINEKSVTRDNGNERVVQWIAHGIK